MTHDLAEEQEALPATGPGDQQSAGARAGQPTLDMLSPEQRAMLARRLLSKRQTLQTAPPARQALIAVAERGRFPISFNQQRLWFLDQLEPHSTLYSIHLGMRLSGALDAQTLALALDQVVQRHEILRTTFSLEQGQPVQVVGAGAAPALRVVDLCDRRPAQRQAALKQLRAAEALRPFDLSEGPLLRAQLLRLDTDDHALLLTLHHIIADHWSINILLDEWLTLYLALLDQQPAPPEPLAIQYGDYACWQHQLLQGDILARQISYWQEQLRGAPALLNLPADYPRPPVQRFQGKNACISIDPTLAQALRELSQRSGTTLFMTLLAAYALLLSRYSRQEDIVIGAPFANRTHKLVEPLIGFFVNTLALRLNLRQDQSFAELLRQARQVTLDALENQDVPFEQVVDALKLERSLSYNPLFQVMFDMHVSSRKARSLPGLAIEPLGNAGLEQAEQESAKFDLTLTVSDTEQGLELECCYNSDLFASATIERMLRHYQTLLEGIVASPQQQLGALLLLRAAEVGQLLGALRGPQRAGPAPLSLHALIERQATRTPKRVAVVSAEQQLSYAELNAAADQLALKLRQLGVGPQVQVGLYLERSPELIVALLAVLKAGGAYVPLDPSYPQERIASMIRGARIGLLLSTSQLRAQLPQAVSQVVCIDAPVPCGSSSAPPDSRASVDDLLYTIYTSGSTGQPKGAGVYQSGFLNLLWWYIESFQLGADDRILVISSPSFDLTQKNFFAPLLLGGALHLAPPGRYDPSQILRTIERQGITTINCTPSAFYALVEAARQDGFAALASLRHVFLGGEPIALALLQPWASSPHYRAEIVNTYGPTECSDICAFYQLPAPNQWGEAAVPIGRPIDNTQLVVVDEQLRLVPGGVAGELCVAGAGVGLGYINDPQLTALKFMPNPFNLLGDHQGSMAARSASVLAGAGALDSVPASAPASRLYRTGDLVRCREDGLIEYLGRIDNQVKLRGFRIELGEIDAALALHPAVREAVVTAQEDQRGSARLVAYVVPAPELQTQSIAEQLRAFLRDQLPDYMLPAAFILLEALPLTSSGKVERRALPRPDWAQLAPAAIYVAPRTPIEQLVADLWAQLLGLSRVGRHDNFFALGGHSLLATQVISRLRERFGIELAVRVVFEASSVEALAREVHSALQKRSGTHMPPIEPAPRDQQLPLSFAQERLWFLDQLERGSTAYTIPLALRLSGSLDAAALELALTRLVERHESLRTTIAAPDGQPIQVIARAEPFRLPVLDLRELDQQRRASMIQRLVEEEREQAFDLARGPLFRARLLRAAGDEHLLLLNLHHIITDGWSMEILQQELLALYTASSQGRVAQLPALPLQYADYAIWQRRWFVGDIYEQQLCYWKEQLAGLATLDLPSDRPRPAFQSANGAAEPIVLPAELSVAIARLSQAEGVTLFMALLAAFQALLGRYSGQSDFAVGAPIAGRNHGATERITGLFVNTLVLRADLAGNPSYRELLRRTRETTLAAYAHQDMPFERVVDALQAGRDLSRSPLFQVMFELQTASPAAVSEEQMPDLRISSLPVETLTAKFDLTLTLQESQAGLQGMFEYNTDLFDAITLRRMAGHLQVLLEAALAEPERPLASLELLTPAERRLLLVEWNATARPFPLERGFIALFAEQAAHTPEAIAIEDQQQKISYQALLTRAERLAAALRAAGVGRESVVPLLAERGVDFITGILAIFMAGGAYLPLDPAHPPQRISQMLRQSRCAYLLVARCCGTLLPELPADDDGGPAVLWLDELEAGAAGAPALDLAPVEPANLAYVLFTSGSTGLPKGVLIEHAGMLNHLLLMVEELGLTAADTVAQSASQCFDISVWQMLTPLLVGARVVVLDDMTMRDPSAVCAAVSRSGITVLQLVPALLSGLLNLSGAEAIAGLRRLRWLIPTGEALPPALARCWLERYPHVPLLNAYGPAECADDVTLAHITTPPPAETVSMSIGDPVANMRVYILDRHARPLPAGVVGELYIGGVGVGRGYLYEPARTAESFVPDPFAGEPGCRLYRTGDLVRYRLDGTLEFIGRADHQVKIRGHRIELGEVEAALLRHPAIREAALLAREDTPGQQRLVAYVVAAAPPQPGAEAQQLPQELRTWLQALLPEYMVPAAYVTLEHMPLTANGKLDRRALPPPGPAAYARTSGADRAPTPDEALVARVWAEVLQLDDIGLEENFFSLGGHSLLATQVVSRLQAAFQIDLPLRTLFERPTVAQLAAALATRQRSFGDTPAIVRVERSGPLPLSFSQRRLWFLDQFEPGTPAYNMSSSLRLRGPLEIQALSQALDEVVRRHEALRTVFATQDGEPVQIVLQPCGAGLRLIDLSAVGLDEPAAHARRLIQAETGHRFDLARGPLFRATLIRLEAADHILCLNLHHIISDGWSEGILVQEIVTLYRAFMDGSPASLPELLVQYADYAAWQQRVLQGAYLEKLLAYWRAQLDAQSAPLSLPTDHPRPAIRSSTGGLLPYAVDREVVAGLRQLATSAGVSLYMLVLAALKTLLYRYSHDPAISVGSYIANRHRQEIEPLIGFFVNTLVLRTDLSGAPTFRQLLERVRAVTLAAYEHQDVPFEKLIEELQPARDLSRTPFFQVMLVLQNTPEGGTELPDLAIEPFELEGGEVHAHYDLTLWLGGQGDLLTGSWEYNADLFEHHTIEHMAGQLNQLLRAVVADPDQCIATIDLLPAQERRRLLQRWHGPRAAYPDEPGLLTIFERWAEQHPHATAVLSQEQSISYAELEARANQLAHTLQALGVGPEALVAICLSRSIELIVAVLAVWKAGGAYVPLDPAYPSERLALMLGDSAPLAVITERSTSAILPATASPLLCLDCRREQIASASPERPISRSSGQSLAYMVYTSGSTDTPKGVLVEQRSLVNASHAWREAYALRPGQRHLQMASFSFDVFTGDLARALGSGGALVLCPRELLLDPQGLYRLIQQHAPVCAEFVPAVVRELLRAMPEHGQSLDGLVEPLIVGSDLWSMEEYRQLRDSCGPARVINSYGLSEATIDSTYFAGSALALAPSRAVPIGTPFANTQLYILDQHMQPVPAGVAGELYIGGAGLARGYHHQPRRSAERFVPDPFGGQPGARLYRSGDMARALPDGNVEFLGRNDHQVKIRGFRVELSEIQAALAQHPAVAEALVVAWPSAQSPTTLCAYLVPRPGQELRADQLRSALRQRLPEHMIPSAFVELAYFPLTPNGKINRQALPAPDLSTRALGQPYRPPRNAAELQLAEIWEDLLGVAPVGVEDNFFDLGGHSLLAVHLIARVQQRLGQQLSLAALFQGPTVESMAALLASRGSAAWSPLVAMRTKGSGRPLFCVPGAGGNVISYYELARRLDSDRPIYGLQARGIDGEAAPHTSVEEMAACYVEAIRQVQPQGPYALCGYSFGSWVAFEIAQQIQRQGEAVDLLAILNTPTPLVMSPELAGATPAEQQDDGALLLAVARSIERAFGTELGITRELLGQLSPDEQIIYLTEQLKLAGILPPEAETKQVRGYVEVFKTNYAISYMPRTWLPTRIVLFRASERHVDDEDVPLAIRDDAAWGWNEFASEPVPVHLVSGEHLTMLNEPHVQAIVEQLGRYLGTPAQAAEATCVEEIKYDS